MKRILFLVPLLYIAGCTTLKLQNDVLSKTDEDFTHGTELVYERPINQAPSIFSNAAKALPDITLDGGEEPTHVTFTAGQHIYTPSSLRTEELLVNDNPYAGWLFGQLDRHVITEDSKRTTGVAVGLIGEYSGAEWMQKFVHNDLGKGTDPKGWHHQLDTEVGLVGIYADEDKVFEYEIGPIDIDAVSKLQTRLGNIHTDVSYGRQLRFGKGMPAFTGYQTKYSLYGYCGAEVAGVARNIFYDGNTFSDSHSVGSEPIVGRMKSGIVTQILGWEIGFNYIYTTPEHQHRDSGHGVWMLSISKALQDLFE